MFDPAWTQACTSCSFLIGQLPLKHLEHLHARDTTLVLVSRAEFEKLEKVKQRRGWNVSWYSSSGSTFNYDFNVTVAQSPEGKALPYSFESYTDVPKHQKSSEQPGISVFLKVGDDIYHSYSAYSRGLGKSVRICVILQDTLGENFIPQLANFDHGSDNMLATYSLLDLTPFGRQDTEKNEGLGFHLHDEY